MKLRINIQVEAEIDPKDVKGERADWLELATARCQERVKAWFNADEVPAEVKATVTLE